MMETQREDPISKRDLLIIIGVVLGLIGGYRALRWVLMPAPVILRVQPVASRGGECRVEVWVAGKPGDHLFRLKEYGRSGKAWSRGVAILSKDRASVDLPATTRTVQGECSISQYHLVVDGQVVESMDPAQ